MLNESSVLCSTSTLECSGCIPLRFSLFSLPARRCNEDVLSIETAVAIKMWLPIAIYHRPTSTHPTVERREMSTVTLRSVLNQNARKGALKIPLGAPPSHIELAEMSTNAKSSSFLSFPFPSLPFPYNSYSCTPFLASTRWPGRRSEEGDPSSFASEHVSVMLVS
jgi:hypothetical protein